MGYQVLARKWRPTCFDEMVGQDHVLKALINALDKQRLHHAYLFTGTRGVGKTTIARILARCLNCEEGVSSKPCGTCSACTQIDEGRFVDLIEVDAASRTKVDDTRELLDNVQYKPSVGRYKVYLIDEVHMLSTHSFNALLKTLEEPPPHVKFLLATTDPQKLPVTVLSRCLQFNLKRVSETQIAAHLADILQRESVDFDQTAMHALAQAADGSIRDGMSLLDQAISFGDGAVTDAETSAMLGSISPHFLHDLVQALSAFDPRAVISVVEKMAEFSPDFEAVLSALITEFHHLALAQQMPEILETRLTDPQPVIELARQISPEDIQLWYEIAVHTRRDLSIAVSPRQGFEMGLLRMLVFRPADAADSPPAPPPKSMPVITAPPTNLGAAPAQSSPPVEAKPSIASVKPPEQAVVSPQPPVAAELEIPPVDNTPPVGSALPPAAGEGWDQILPRLGLKTFTQAFASNCTLVKHVSNTLTLAVSKHHELLFNANVEQKMVVALTQYYGEATALKVVIQGGEVQSSPAAQKNRQVKADQMGAESSIKNDLVVKRLADELGAVVVPGSVRPLNE